MAAHLKIETGMRRTGFTPASLREAMDELLLMHDLMWEGVYTHFADATDASFTRRQYRIFEGLVEELPQHGLHVPLRHVCNSAATLLYPELHLEMVRVGTLLYGQLPAGIRQPELPEGLQLNNPWSLWARVVHLQPVSPGDSVGYGRTHRVRRKTVLAVLPVGYSDGFGLDVIPLSGGADRPAQSVGQDCRRLARHPGGTTPGKRQWPPGAVAGADRHGIKLCGRGQNSRSGSGGSGAAAKPPHRHQGLGAAGLCQRGSGGEGPRPWLRQF